MSIDVAPRTGDGRSGDIFSPASGAKDIGVNEDYCTAQIPPVNSGLLNGQLAWWQRDGGHTDGPNWKYFVPWADKFFSYRGKLWQVAPDQPLFQTDANSLVAHSQLLAKTKQGGIEVIGSK